VEIEKSKKKTTEKESKSKKESKKSMFVVIGNCRIGKTENN
jgi:hypothetical protein